MIVSVDIVDRGAETGSVVKTSTVNISDGTTSAGVCGGGVSFACVESSVINISGDAKTTAPITSGSNGVTKKSEINISEDS